MAHYDNISHRRGVCRLRARSVRRTGTFGGTFVAAFFFASSFSVSGFAFALQPAQNARPAYSADTLNARAQEFLNKNDDSANALAAQALELARAEGNKRAAAGALRALATVNNNRSRNVEALRQYDSALALYREIADTSGAATVWNGKGVLYMKQGQYDKSLAHLLQSLRLREQTENWSAVGASLNNIGLLYKTQKKYAEALQYYNQALALKEQAGDKQGISNALNTLGELFIIRGEYDRALERHRRALELRRALNARRGIATSLNGIGMALKGKKEYAAAAAYLDSALALRSALQDNEGAMVTRSYLSATFREWGFPAKAVEQALAGLALADSLRSPRQQLALTRDLAAASAARGDHKRAYAAQKRAYELKDSLYNDESVRKFADIQTQYDVEKKDREIALLRSNESFRRWQLNSLIVGLLLVIALAALLLQRYYARRRALARLQQAHAHIQAQRDIIAEWNERLEEQNQSLEALNQEKDELLGIAAHDLKNPLNSIYNMATMITEYDDSLSQNEKREFLRQIVGASERMFALIKNLLDINALEGGGMTFHIERVELATVLDTVIVQYSERAAQKNIALSLRCSGSLWAFADASAAEQILSNLVSNAIKYSPRGRSVSVEASETANSDSERCVRVAVRDEGPGLSDEDKKRLFGKFARLSAQPTGNEHSTGLGLSIVKKLSEAMGGRVWCESELGAGAAFFVELPRPTEQTEEINAE